MTTREEWVALVREWRLSGESARQFATRRGVADTALRYWASRLGQPASKRGRPRATEAVRTPTLARVVRPGEAPPADDAAITILVGRITIAVRHGFEAATLREVLRALSEVE